MKFNIKTNIPRVLDKITIMKDTMKIHDVVINMENEKLEGNVLDIGMDNYGVVYQMCKSNEELSIDYIDKEEESKVIEKNFYDTAVLFFTMGKFNSKLSKKKLISEVYDYLKDDGEIKIWDIDKTVMSAANLRVRVLLPEKKVKNIVIRDFNIIKNRSKEVICNLLSPMFEIIEMNVLDNIYYIKGRKIKKGMT